MPAQVFNGADRFVARLRVLDGNVALFSHGHLGRVLAARWVGLPVSEARPHNPQFSVSVRHQLV
jgi:probable phosphoglycerate mutase